MAVGNSGARRWEFRYTRPITRKRRETGLGLGLSLADARRVAEKMRGAATAGRDPLLEAEEIAEAKHAELAAKAAAQVAA